MAARVVGPFLVEVSSVSEVMHHLLRATDGNADMAEPLDIHLLSAVVLQHCRVSRVWNIGGAIHIVPVPIGGICIDRSVIR